MACQGRRKIYLIRHGDIDLKGEKRFIGQTDLPLSYQGIEQAQRLKEKLAEVSFDKIYCSDLIRSIQTAVIIANGQKIPPEVRTELREMNLGEWDGLSFQDISIKYPEEFKQRGKDIANYRTIKGESFADCHQRIIPFFDNIAKSNTGDDLEENILIVSHAGINRVILAHILGISLDNVFKLDQGYGCINLITHSEKGYCLNKLNYVPE